MGWRLQARLNDAGRVIFGSVLFPYLTTGIFSVRSFFHIWLGFLFSVRSFFHIWLGFLFSVRSFSNFWLGFLFSVRSFSYFWLESLFFYVMFSLFLTGSFSLFWLWRAVFYFWLGAFILDWVFIPSRPPGGPHRAPSLNFWEAPPLKLSVFFWYQDLDARILVPGPQHSTAQAWPTGQIPSSALAKIT